jgi:hypothetical protein
MLVGVLSLYPNASVDAALISKTLDEDTRIAPPKVIVAMQGEIPMFKKGTVVILNEYGEVLEGVLAKTISLPYETGTPLESIRPAAYTPPIMIPYYVQDNKPKYRVLPFKGDTKVVFNDKGEVVKGTTTAYRENIDLNQTNHILINDGEISFHKNGMVATCRLAKDSFLRPVGVGTDFNCELHKEHGMFRTC